jgi:hypothetical protein
MKNYPFPWIAILSKAKNLIILTGSRSFAAFRMTIKPFFNSLLMAVNGNNCPVFPGKTADADPDDTDRQAAPRPEGCQESFNEWLLVNNYYLIVKVGCWRRLNFLFKRWGKLNRGKVRLFCSIKHRL